MITEGKFVERVGHYPRDDDLDRSNCPDAGKVGHMLCGWDAELDLPVFIAVAIKTPAGD
jgi:hypothetical protein